MIKDIHLDGINGFLPPNTQSQAKKKSADAAIEKEDVEVNLTGYAQLASESTDRSARVAEIKMAIQNNSYSVDKDKLSTNIYHQIFGAMTTNDAN